MGEISEMMLNGTLCQVCGESLIEEGEEPVGFPQTCDACTAADEESEDG